MSGKILTRDEFTQVTQDLRLDSLTSQEQLLDDHDQALRELVQDLRAALEGATALDLGTENGVQLWHCEQCGGNGQGDGDIEHKPHCSIGKLLARAKAVKP